MIKKLILAILVALPTMAYAQKFGTVDPQAVMIAMPELKEAQSTIEASAKTFENEYAELQKTLEKAIQDYKELAPDTPDSIKQRREEDIQSIQQRMYTFQQTAQKELAELEQKQLQPLQQKILDALNAVIAENNFTMVFDKSAGVYPGAGVEDVTPLVKSKLGIQ